MPDRQPERWETNAAGPFLTLPRERGTVEVYAHSHERFTVKAPDNEQQVVGYAAAREVARTLASHLD